MLIFKIYPITDSPLDFSVGEVTKNSLDDFVLCFIGKQQTCLPFELFAYLMEFISIFLCLCATQSKGHHFIFTKVKSVREELEIHQIKNDKKRRKVSEVNHFFSPSKKYIIRIKKNVLIEWASFSAIFQLYKTMLGKHFSVLCPEASMTC